MMSPTELQNLVGYIRGDEPSLVTTTEVEGKQLIDSVESLESGLMTYIKDADATRPEYINNAFRFSEPNHRLNSASNITVRSATGVQTIGFKLKNWSGGTTNGWFFQGGGGSQQININRTNEGYFFRTGSANAQKDGVDYELPVSSLPSAGEDIIFIISYNNDTGITKLAFRDNNGNRAEELNLTGNTLDNTLAPFGWLTNGSTTGETGDLTIAFHSHDFVTDQELRDLYNFLDNDGASPLPEGVITHNNQPVEGAVVTYLQADPVNESNVDVNGTWVKQITDATILGESITNSQGEHEYTGEAFDDTKLLGIKVDYMWWDTDKWRKYSKTEWSDLNLDLSDPTV